LLQGVDFAVGGSERSWGQHAAGETEEDQRRVRGERTNHLLIPSRCTSARLTPTQRAGKHTNFTLLLLLLLRPPPPITLFNCPRRILSQAHYFPFRRGGKLFVFFPGHARNSQKTKNTCIFQQSFSWFSKVVHFIENENKNYWPNLFLK